MDEPEEKAVLTVTERARLGGQTVARVLGSEHMATIGRRGGNTVSRDRAHMAEIGRMGATSTNRRRQRGRQDEDGAQGRDQPAPG